LDLGHLTQPNLPLKHIRDTFDSFYTRFNVFVLIFAYWFFSSPFISFFFYQGLINSMPSFSVQHLMSEISKDADRLSAFYSQHILPYLARRSKATYIAAAIAAFVSYQVYRLVHIPRKLQHIPAVSFWAYMRSALSGAATDGRLDLIYSVLDKSPNGLYLKPTRGGWGVGVVGPQALRTVFLRKG
jgi:type IV secretory pathway TraG/TraD family ATPase VirD4